MKRLFSFSLLLNVALLCIYWGRGLGHDSIRRLPRSVVGQPAAQGLQHVARNRTSVNEPPIFWRQVQSSDPSRFAANLRSIGCPEETIRDIVVLQICRHYRGRILDLESESARNWDYTHERKDRKQFYSQRSDLRDEMITSIESVFGQNWTSVAFSVLGWPDRDDGMSFLTVENRRQLRELERKYRDEIDELESKQISGTLSLEGQARLLELRRNQESELAAILSQQQLEEYQYYRSDAATYVRDSLPPAKSEAEFRMMVQVAEDFGPGAWRNPREGAPDNPDEYLREFQKQKAALQERLKVVLGEDRIAEQEQEEKARAEEEERQRKRQTEEHERAEFASMAEEAGVPAPDFARFFERLKQSEEELRPKFEELEKTVTGTPLEKHEKLMAAAKIELDKIAGETLGANAPAMVQKLMEKIDREDRPH